MQNSFYSFDIDYEPQLNTNWCWCACFSWVSKSLKLNTEYKEQHHFQSYYGRYILEKEGPAVEEGANVKSNLLLDTRADHVGRLIRETLKIDYNLIDLAKKNRNKKNILRHTFNHKRIADYLITYNAPWIIATNYHMVLVSGFGSDKFRNYILVSDPDIVENEKFIPFETFIEKYEKGIKKVWQLKHKLSYKPVSKQNAFKEPTQREFPETYILKSDVKSINIIQEDLIRQ